MIKKPSKAAPDSVRAKLRFWALADTVYAVAIALIALFVIPWKTEMANIALLLYALLHGTGAPWLFKARKTGYRLSVVSGMLGLLGAVVVCAGLFSSFAYLFGIFGDLGYGTAIGALLIASLAMQILGLYPALKLKTLLGGEVRRHFDFGPKILFAIAGLWSIPPVLALVVFFFFELNPVAPLSQNAKNQTAAYMRAALDGALRPEPIALRGIPLGPGPLYATLWQRGEIMARAWSSADNLDAAVREVADRLLAKLKGRGNQGILKIDRVVAVGKIIESPEPFMALSVNPGREGLRRRNGHPSEILLPDDMVRDQVFGTAPLVPGIRELRLGLDTDWVWRKLGPERGPVDRVRVESFIENKGRALPVVRSNTRSDNRGPLAWRQAALSGGDFILRQLMDDGRFYYRYLPIEDARDKGRRYSLPRHAGTVYSLALLYGHTGEERFARGAKKAIEWLEAQIDKECGTEGRACVVSRGRATLGAAALTAVGMLEYERKTRDSRFRSTMRGLMEFVLMMQRKNGDFNHAFEPREDFIDTEKRTMFYSEEAALALVMAHEVLGDERYLRAAERALDYLTGPKYDYFLGRFIYGADHWTCIAAEEAWPRLKSPRYLEFCEGYAKFITRLQYAPNSWSNEDFEGHYGFGAFMVPQAPAAAGFTEAVLSTHDLKEHHGKQAPRLLAQASGALDALARDQIRPDNAWLMPNPDAALGGIRRSLVEQEIRIDFTQHAVSALIRGAAQHPTEENRESYRCLEPEHVIAAALKLIVHSLNLGPVSGQCGQDAVQMSRSLNIDIDKWEDANFSGHAQQLQ